MKKIKHIFSLVKTRIKNTNTIVLILLFIFLLLATFLIVTQQQEKQRINKSNAQNASQSANFQQSIEKPVKPFIDEPKRGLYWAGLKAGKPDGLCYKLFEINDKAGRATGCTHGPDPAPEGIDATKSVEPLATQSAEVSKNTNAEPAVAGISCDGDGTSGYRVQAMYVRAVDKPDRYNTYASSFLQYAQVADNILSQSAAQTGGVRHFRFVTNSSCQPTIIRVTLSATGDDDMTKTMNELKDMGYNRTDRIYLMWVDSTIYCGIANISQNDIPDQSNPNNIGPRYSRIDSGCWGGRPEAHELMHNLGGVQLSAPHTTNQWHCTDQYDRMCEQASSYTYPCSSIEEGHYDCRKDDYFNTNPPAGSYLATHWNTANNRFLIGGAIPPTPTPTPTPNPSMSGTTGSINAITPFRILDTRTTVGGHNKKTLAPKETMYLQVLGVGSIPTTGVSAVVVNVTVVPGSTNGFLTLYPTGVMKPEASSINFNASTNVANQVLVSVGSNGRINLYNSAGYNHVVVDVEGWVGKNYTPPDGKITSFSPKRILDTRTTLGGHLGALGTGQLLTLAVLTELQKQNVQTDGVKAILANVTAVPSSTTAGYVTAYPSDIQMPTTSTVSVNKGTITSNLALIPLSSTSGSINIYSSSGSMNVVVDVQGVVMGDNLVGLQAVQPAGILDTKQNNTPIAAGKSIDFNVLGVGGVPASNVSAVVLHVIATGGTANSYFTVYPSGTTKPDASTLNFTTGKTVSNNIIVPVGANGSVSIYNNSGSAHAIVEMQGWVAAP